MKKAAICVMQVAASFFMIVYHLKTYFTVIYILKYFEKVFLRK